MKTHAFLMLTIPFFLLACAESPSNPEPETSSATPISSETANSSGEHLSSTNSSSFDEEYSSGTEASSSSTTPVSTNFDWQKCVSAGNCGTFKDSRDSRTYKWVTIGEQVWMGENLKYNPGSNCGALGCVYTWSESMAYPEDCSKSFCQGATQNQHKGACPTGWHLPSISEWQGLIQFVKDTTSIFQSKLKATTWDSGTDLYGFSAVPTDSDSTAFWLKDEWQIDQSLGRILKTGFEEPRGFPLHKASKLSIRCIQDYPTSSSSSAISSSGTAKPCATLASDQFCDTRDGKAYTYKRYGVQYWMTQNLNWDGSGYCSFATEAECEKRGRHYSAKGTQIQSLLYGFQQGACPNGWRTPSLADWKGLTYLVVGAQNLKGIDDASNTEWNSSFNNQDSAGFHLLPAGYQSFLEMHRSLSDSLTSANMLTTDAGRGTDEFVFFIIDTRSGNQGTETWFGSERDEWYQAGASLRCIKEDWSKAP